MKFQEIKINTDLEIAQFYNVSQKDIIKARRKNSHKLKTETFLVKKSYNMSPVLSHLLDEPTPYYLLTEAGVQLRN